MALSADTVWEVRTDGDDGNGGGFVTGASGTDYSQQAAAQKSAADLTMHATTDTKCHPGALGVAAADVGNIIYISAGTDWTPGWYEIKSQDGTDWTLDRSPSAAGNANLATFKMGGGIATFATLASVSVGGNVANIRYGTYTAGASVDFSTKTVRIIGHKSGTNRPVLKATANDITLLLGRSTTASVRAMEFDGDTYTGVTGCDYGYGNDRRGLAYDCVARNCAVGFASKTACYYCCAAYDCETGFGLTRANFCYAESCTTAGFIGTSVFCIANACAIGFKHSIGGTFSTNCIAYGSTGNGFKATASSRGDGFVYCIAVNSGGYGFASMDISQAVYCAGYNNTSGHIDKISDARNIGFITLSADPFVDAAGGDFNLNDTEGGGALLRAIGLSLAL